MASEIVNGAANEIRGTSVFDARLIAALAFTLLSWASAFPAIRLCLRPGAYTPVHLALFRFLVASLTLLVCCAFIRIRAPEKRDIPVFVVMGFLSVTVYHTSLNYGASRVTAGAASFLINTAPIFTALLAMLLLRERLRLWGWLGIATSVAGMLIIALGEGNGFRIEPRALFIVLSAFAASIAMIMNKGILRRYSALETSCYSIWCGTFFLCFFAPGLWTTLQNAPLSASIAVVYMGIFPAALSYITWAYVLSRLPASQTATFLYAMPAVTLLVAWLWLGEVPHIATLVGGAVAVCGVVIVNLWGKKPATI